MDILITESQYKNIQEAVGVPPNIKRAASDVFKKIGQIIRTELKISDFEMKRPKNSFPEMNTSIEIPYEFEIGKLHFNGIDLDLGFTMALENDAPENVHWRNMAFSNEQGFDINYRFVNTQKDIDKIKLKINLYVKEVSPEVILKEVGNYFLTNYSTLASSVGHEFAHAVNILSTPYAKVHNRMDYAGYQALSKHNIQAIRNLFFYSYYCTKIESYVRNTEVSMRVDLADVKERDFFKFLKDDKTYLMLKKISEYTFEDFCKELVDELNLVKMFNLAHVFTLLPKIVDFPGKDDDKGHINFFLKKILKDFNMLRLELLKMFLDFEKGPRETLYGKGTDDMFIKHYRDLFEKKYFEDPTYFVEETIETNRAEARRMLKKLPKLFSIIDNEESI